MSQPHEYAAGVDVVRTIDLDWTGPYGWPGFTEADNLSSVPRLPGIYLWTFRYQDGYLIYGAGITGRPVSERIAEHTRHYLAGEYNVLDIDAAECGIRKEIWHGWQYAKAHRDEFDSRKDTILAAVRRQLFGFRIFTAVVEPDVRIRKRIEAAIMNHLYRQPFPFCDIPDKGMSLSKRWESEIPITAINRCDSVLHSLPAQLSI